ncbi:MAG: hypothetical protein OJF59_002563 [Cytophagales bacterium]|nr:MAG: hypothetical protein OJF59_002563 [Cytophagales bacterium]
MIEKRRNDTDLIVIEQFDCSSFKVWVHLPRYAFFPTPTITKLKFTVVGFLILVSYCTE